MQFLKFQFVFSSACDKSIGKLVLFFKKAKLHFCQSKVVSLPPPPSSLLFEQRQAIYYRVKKWVSESQLTSIVQ